MARISKEQERKIYIAIKIDKQTIHSAAKTLGIPKSTVARYAKKFEEPEYVPPDVNEISSDSALKPAKKDEEFDLLGKIDQSNKDIIAILQNLVAEAKRGMEIKDSQTGRAIPLKGLADTLKVALEVAKAIETATANKRLTPETIDYELLAKMYVNFNKETGQFDYDEKKHIKSVLDVAHGKVSPK